jgi:hypothetical protein
VNSGNVRNVTDFVGGFDEEVISGNVDDGGDVKELGEGLRGYDRIGAR